MPDSDLLTILPSGAKPASVTAPAPMPAVAPAPDNSDGDDAPLGVVAIETHGCKLNQADSAALAEQFAAAGCRLTAALPDADVIIVNTCTVTAAADAKARQALRAARRSNPAAVVVAAGCYSQRAADELRRMPEVTLVVGNDAKPELTTLALDALARRPALAAPPAGSPAATRPGRQLSGNGVWRRSRAMLKIQEGCDQVCAYCIVPKVRGRERSIPPDALVQSVRRQQAAGFQEVTLTGTQLGTYGFDLADASLPALLDAILQATDLPRLRVSSLQAHEISADLLSRWQDARLCPHFHIPLQSGCDRTLRAMRRRYDTAQFRRAVALVRRLVPHAAITTDLIVGFPGETDADFAASRDFTAAMRFADIHLFPYSPRPGTSAHYYAGQVPAAAKRARASEMASVKAAGFDAFRRLMTGQTRSVLWETARPDADGRMQWRGRTDNYLRTVCLSEANLAGRITPARLTGLNAGGLMTAKVE